MSFTAKKFQSLLLAWFDQHGRKNLPWQKNKTPYRVWVSEIMLQQTQVATVIPYFERFMQTFPDIQTLAHAPQDAVLHLWAGLGYYSRARNLHQAAKTVVEKFSGNFPNTLDDLQSLPGIGASTAGAILALAMNQSATILDGNVKRVLARLHGITEPINEKKTENKLWQLAVNYTPQERIADYTQAMMDVGATLCTRSKPLCAQCPFTKNCVAYQQNLTHLLPTKKAPRSIPTRAATFLIFKHKDKILLHKRAPHGIWGGLFCLPQLDGEPLLTTISDYCRRLFKISVSTYQTLTSFRHTFSHFHLDIFPIIIDIPKLPAKMMAADEQIWYNPEQPEPIGLPKPIQSIMRSLP